jgi:hypothetical protein
MQTHKDIQLVGVDKEQTRPFQDTQLVEVFFTISDTPQPKWRDIFDVEWGMFRFDKRNAEVIVRSIKVICLPDEIEANLEYLKLTVPKVNATHKEHCEKVAREAAEKARRAAEQTQKVNSILDGLKF